MLEIPSKHAPKIDDLAWDKDNDSLAILTVSISSFFWRCLNLNLFILQIGDQRDFDLVYGPAQVLRHRNGKLEGEGFIHLLVRSLSRARYRL